MDAELSPCPGDATPAPGPRSLDVDPPAAASADAKPAQAPRSLEGESAGAAPAHSARSFDGESAGDAHRLVRSGRVRAGDDADGFNLLRSSPFSTDAVADRLIGLGPSSAGTTGAATAGAAAAGAGGTPSPRSPACCDSFAASLASKALSLASIARQRCFRSCRCFYQVQLATATRNKTTSCEFRCEDATPPLAHPPPTQPQRCFWWSQPRVRRTRWTALWIIRRRRTSQSRPPPRAATPHSSAQLTARGGMPR